MYSNGQAPHIVVCNHAVEILDLLEELLTGEGYRVTTHAREGESLDAIVAADPDLIVIDSMWPSSGDEWTLLNLLRIDPRTRSIPVIVCTAAVRQVRDMAAHLKSIKVRVVLKPFDIDHLLAEVRDALEPGSRMESGPRPVGT